MQSSTVALLSAHGVLEPLEAGIFADTQGEPPSVYAWLDYLTSLLPFPVYRVTNGDLAASNLQIKRSGRSGQLYQKVSIPFFTPVASGHGMLHRQCTRDFKVAPVEKSCAS